MKMLLNSIKLLILVNLLVISTPLFPKNIEINEASTYSAFKFRGLGPALASGRVSDIAVNPNNFDEFYIAVASGGVWKTTNHGINFKPIFDKQNSYSIGCVTIDPNNTNIVWVGTGENNSQRSVSYGDGVYKSLDGGKTWNNMGLENSEHIGKIIINPNNSNEVWVAAQGPLWKAGGDRGLYKTTDGGKTWENQYEDEYTDFGLNDVFFLNENLGIALSYVDSYYTTTNGGNKWSKQKRTKYNEFIEHNKAFASDKYLFQFVGDGGLFRYDLSLLNITSVPLDEYSLVGTYPNPFYNEFTISSTEITNDNYNVSIYDINANKVYSDNKYIDGDITINQDFVAGTYYLIIENDKRNYMQKIVRR
jgi:hypothetical protein